jgi:5-methylcytosine-specific restriction endonuclease McrA
MPDPDGKLTPDDYRKAGEFFNELEKKAGKELACEVCGNTIWVINTHLLGQRTDSLDVVGPHLRFPSVMFFCRECGNQKFFVAQKVGIMPLGTPYIPGKETPDAD